MSKKLSKPKKKISPPGLGQVVVTAGVVVGVVTSIAATRKKTSITPKSTTADHKLTATQEPVFAKLENALETSTSAAHIEKILSRHELNAIQKELEEDQKQFEHMQAELENNSITIERFNNIYKAIDEKLQTHEALLTVSLKNAQDSLNETKETLDRLKELKLDTIDGYSKEQVRQLAFDLDLKEQDNLEWERIIAFKKDPMNAFLNDRRHFWHALSSSPVTIFQDKLKSIARAKIEELEQSVDKQNRAIDKTEETLKTVQATKIQLKNIPEQADESSVESLKGKAMHLLSIVVSAIKATKQLVGVLLTDPSNFRNAWREVAQEQEKEEVGESSQVDTDPIIMPTPQSVVVSAQTDHQLAHSQQFGR